jgi:type VI secretion system protein ImpL
MNKKSYIIIGTILVSFTVFVGWLGSNIRKVPGLSHADPFVVQAVVLVLGIVAAAIATWIMSKKDKKSGSDSGAAAEAPEEVTDLDELLAEAEARLAEAQQQKDSKLGKLPAILLIGETGSAKTTTMVHSGAEPESLAGQVYEENNILPTPAANFWFAHHTIFVEMAGKLLGDSDSWKQLIGRLQPPKAAALLGTAEAVPRAALVCVDAETLTSPSPDPLAASARKLRAQLAEISQLLGINLPVYVLFTRSDRLPFFTEYVGKLNNQEATRILGATLPIVPVRQGIYAEQETARLSGVFEKMFRALCNARPNYLVRESDPLQLAGIYEFPREFRKIRLPLVRFLVELCRPSQLTVGPFLRGFYFSGVRPIMVNEVAPVAPSAPESQSAGGRVGATGMFRSRGGAAQPAAAGQRIIGTRKVPQWLFLGHFFNDLLLADQVAKGASASSIRASMPRRILLLTAAALCLIYSTALVISFGRNRALANGVKQASQGIAAVDSSGGDVASLDSLKRLETLRQSLETLTKYNREGAPWSYRWGLYIGNDLYPEVHKLYFADFRRLLLAPTQNILVDSMRTLPPTPGPEYGPTYDSLKAYLITTSNHDKSTHSFLPPVLLSRWSANRNVDPGRMQLAQKQFEFYSDELKIANPFSNDNDAAAIGKARLYLSQFAGFERVYQAMLTDAAKTGPAINFNKRFPGSAEEVIDAQDVASPFTKPGWDFMKAALRNPEKYFAGEPWVLGEQATANIDRSKLGQQLADRYYSDFLKAWRDYLKAASVVRYASLPDAAKKLGVLSGNQSPLLALFWLASQNTAVDLPDVANAFQPVQTVVPPTNVDRYIAPANQTYMNALVTLQASVDTVAQQPGGSDSPAAALTLTNATNAKVAARQVAQAFRIDPDAHVEATVQKLMEDPITNVEALLRNLGPAELNGKGKTLCSVYRPVLNKYPFNPTATAQATIADVNGIFHKPDGAFWKFYDENLQKLLPKQGSQYVAATVGGVTLTPAFVAFFNQAAAFGEALYAGGTPDPHFTYTLKPVPSDGIQTVGLHLDGQSFSYSGGDATPKQFLWQASGTHEAKATVKFGGGPELAWSTNDGLWAIFQFFNKAETWRPSGSGNMLEWVIRIGKDPVLLPGGKPLTVRFELDMGGSPQVFQKGYFSRMACVAEVAK